MNDVISEAPERWVKAVRIIENGKSLKPLTNQEWEKFQRLVKLIDDNSTVKTIGIGLYGLTIGMEKKPDSTLDFTPISYLCILAFQKIFFGFY